MDEEALLNFFNELMLIDDYRAFYEYAYEKYIEPTETCFGEGGEAPCIIHDPNPRGKIKVYLGGYQPDEVGQGEELLNLMIESKIKPSMDVNREN